MTVMRIRTDGNYAWRKDLVDDVGAQLNERTRSGAVDGACEFTRQMLPALQEAVEHPDMTSELAEILSTDIVDVSYQIEVDVTIK